MAIDKYMYVILNVPNADRLIRLHYTKSETVDDARDSSTNWRAKP